MILPALLVVVGVRTCATAIRRGQRVWGALAIGGGLAIYIAGILVTDIGIAERVSSEIDQCRKHLEEIGRALPAFQARYGRAPQHLAELYQKMKIPLCPAHRDQLDGGYTYRPPRGRGGRRMVCWDTQPHVYNYRYLKPFRRAYRNVLFSDGTVETLEEKQVPVAGPGGAP